MEWLCVERAFRELVEERLEWGPPHMVEREVEVPISPGLATAVVEPRRAGKTYLLFQLGARTRSL